MEQTERPETIDFDKPFVYVGVSESAARIETYAETKRFFNIEGRIHLVLMLTGDNTSLVLADFEQTLYPYNTKQNANYHCRVFGWQKLGWSIVSIPTRDEVRARNFFATHNRQLVKGEQFTAFSKNGSELFPFTGEAFRLVRNVGGLLLALSNK